MAVNSMSFEDASALINLVKEQLTGESSIAPVSEEEFVKVGTTLLQTGYDQLNTALSQVLNKTIYAVRNYEEQFPGLERDSQEWGGIIRKVTFIDGDFETDVAMDPTAMANGQSPDPFKINRRKAVQFNFYGGTTVEYCDTMTEDQMNSVFSSSAEFGSYAAARMSELLNQFTQKKEVEDRLTFLNVMAAVIDDGTNVIHALTEYKAATGNVTITRANVYSNDEFVPFAKWLYGRLNNQITMLKQRSDKYHFNITTYNGAALDHPIMRHTPREDLSIYMLDQFMQQINSSVLSSVYNNELLSVGDYNSVAFWQAIDDPDEIAITPNVLQADGTVVAASDPIETADVIGMMFDRETCGITTINEGVRSIYNPRGRYFNNWYNWRIRSYNDLTENALVIMLD